VVTLCGIQVKIWALEPIEGLLGKMKDFLIFYAVCSPSLGPCAR
jgi:hypothetical protein